MLVPKMDGTLHLHENAKEMKLDLSHFVWGAIEPEF